MYKLCETTLISWNFRVLYCFVETLARICPRCATYGTAIGCRNKSSLLQERCGTRYVTELVEIRYQPSASARYKAATTIYMDDRAMRPFAVTRDAASRSLHVRYTVTVSGHLPSPGGYTM